MTIEAFLNVKLPNWRKEIFNWKKAMLASFLILLTFCLLDLNMILNEEYSLNATSNGTRCVEISNSTYQGWFKVNI